MAAVPNPEKDLIPVTILTGFLGAGKTTLLNRILTSARREDRGDRERVRRDGRGQRDPRRGPRGADRGDEQRMPVLHRPRRPRAHPRDLGKKRRQGKLKFDRVLIETTGLANPGPVAQTFFMDEDVHKEYLLDAVITVVDAKHGQRQLDEHDEARAQVGFADRILLSKTDLVAESELADLMDRLRDMNPRAHQKKVHFARPTSGRSSTSAAST